MNETLEQLVREYDELYAPRPGHGRALAYYETGKPSRTIENLTDRLIAAVRMELSATLDNGRGDAHTSIVNA